MGATSHAVRMAHGRSCPAAEPLIQQSLAPPRGMVRPRAAPAFRECVAADRQALSQSETPCA
jgi:hypothetical protein